MSKIKGNPVQEDTVLENSSTRRSFLRQTSIAGAGLLAPMAVAERMAGVKEKDDDEIATADDAVNNRAVGNRILVIFVLQRNLLRKKPPFDVSSQSRTKDSTISAALARIEQLEEDF